MQQGSALKLEQLWDALKFAGQYTTGIFTEICSFSISHINKQNLYSKSLFFFASFKNLVSVQDFSFPSVMSKLFSDVGNLVSYCHKILFLLVSYLCSYDLVKVAFLHQNCLSSIQHSFHCSFYKIMLTCILCYFLFELSRANDRQNAALCTEISLVCLF